jgi:hypothetical protein
MDVPASEPGSQGVFDGQIETADVSDPLAAIKAYADRLAAASHRYQGHGFVAFLRKLTRDPEPCCLQTACLKRKLLLALLEFGDIRVNGHCPAIVGLAPTHKDPTTVATPLQLMIPAADVAPKAKRAIPADCSDSELLASMIRLCLSVETSKSASLLLCRRSSQITFRGSREPSAWASG